MTLIQLNEAALNEVMNQINNYCYMNDMFNTPQLKIKSAMIMLTDFIKQNPSLLNLKKDDDN